MKKVYLKHGAKDKDGNPLDTRTEYILVYMGVKYSTIKNGYGKKICVNNKYIKRPDRK